MNRFLVLSFILMAYAGASDAKVKPFTVQTNEQVKYSKADAYCLAKNIYHEAGVESTAGKYAVAQVTLNRLKTGQWGNSICKVVYSKAQFSWTLQAKKVKEVPKGRLWEESKKVASTVLTKGTRVPSLAKSTFYHADHMTPKWAKKVAKVQQVGAHIFYKKA